MYTPIFTATPRTFTLLEEISRLWERLRASTVRLPWVPALVKEARARLAWGSTAIEGCTLSLEAVRKLVEGGQPLGYPERHVRMARNYLGALTWLGERGRSRAFARKDLLGLHRMIAEEAVDEGPVGAFRKVDVRAGLHVAPSWKKIPQLCDEFVAWVAGPAKDLPAVFSSAIAHLRLAEIHPFRDGNGRVARAFATWELYRRGFDALHIFSLDEVLLENQALYIKNLQRIQVEKRDLGGWIEFMAETVLETLERLESRLRALGPASAQPLSLTVRQERLLRALRERGELGITDMARTLRVTAPGAHYALGPLLKAGLVRRIGTHKKTRYTLASMDEESPDNRVGKNTITRPSTGSSYHRSSSVQFS